ncbi:hypothetical protein KIM67_15240 [Flagellimonas sp. 389]|uniref:DUF6452 family protein n=1 Tax=Flagellimonas sp. 389 TaxID=2835862 RepID=UPI001BD4B2C4|nr:DUF6452 family protein [Flagellimonas sp. 389]MBS9463773.1 hypothetical protein [Flagellimonas sp. 389]
MKRIIPIVILTFLIGYFASCEKDDICVDGDTPLLIIGFYDAIDTTLFKSVPTFRIRALDNDSIFSSDTFTDRSNSSDSIFIPLRVDANNTRFTFITNSADDAETEAETGDIDTLTFNYEPREAFASKACGFVGNYDNLSITLPESDNNWIEDITIVQQTIENSNTIHVKIFH